MTKAHHTFAKSTKKYENNKGVDQITFILFDTKEVLLHTQKYIEKQKSNREDLNNAIDLSQKYKICFNLA